MSESPSDKVDLHRGNVKAAAGLSRMSLRKPEEDVRLVTCWTVAYSTIFFSFLFFHVEVILYATIFVFGN